MPLAGNITGNFYVTADTTDLLSSHVALKSAGPGIYDVYARSTVVDSTITINDGKSDVVSAEPIWAEAAGVTYPAFDIRKDAPWRVKTSSRDRLQIDIADGTNGEIVVKVVKVG